MWQLEEDFRLVRCLAVEWQEIKKWIHASAEILRQFSAKSALTGAGAPAVMDCGMSIPGIVPLNVPGSSLPQTEETVWTGHPSHWHYFWAWFFAILLTPFLIGLLIIPFIFIARNRRLYIVTSKKVVFESGIFVRSTREVRIQDIRSINVYRRGIGGLFGIGTVEFSSAARDDADVIFASISKAETVRQLVSRYQ